MILITGGSSGIGLAVAKQLAATKAKIVLVARTMDKLLEAREVEMKGGECYVYSCDLSNAEACASW